MARSLGEAYVSILPDTSMFREKAQAAIKKALEGIKPTVTIGLDDDKLTDQAKAAGQKARKAAGNVRMKADLDDNTKAAVTRIRANLDELRKNAVDIKARLNTEELDREMLAEQVKIEALFKRTYSVKTDVDTAKLDFEIEAEKLKLDALVRKHYNIHVDLDRDPVNRALDAIGNLVTGTFSKIFARLKSDSGKQAGGIASTFAKRFIASIALQSPGITAAVVAAFAALPALIGVAGVGIGVALGVGVIAGAITMLKSQQKKITAQIKTLTTQNTSGTAKVSSAQLAITGTQNTIKQLSSQKSLTAAQQAQLATARAKLPVEQQSLATAQKQVGTSGQQLAALQKQQAALQKQLDAYKPITDQVTKLKSSFLQFALVTSRPLIKPIAGALKDLNSQLTGPLEKNFKGLFSATAPYVRPLLTMLTGLVNAVLPGLTDMLNKARGPLSFFLVNLGKIVGTQLGNWFKAAEPFIKSSGTYLLDVVNALGNIGTFAIKAGGHLANGFVAALPTLKSLWDIFSSVAGMFTRMLLPALEQLAPALAPLAVVFAQQAAAITKSFAPAIQAVVNVLVVVIKWLAKFLTAHPAIVKAILGIALAWKLLSIAFSLSPFGAIVTALIIVAAVIYKYRKQIVNGLIGAWNFVKSWTIRIWNDILGYFKRLWPLLLGVFGPVGILAGFVIMHWKSVRNATVQVWNSIRNFFVGVWQGIHDTAIGSVNRLVNGVTGAWNFVKSWTVRIWNGIGDFFTKTIPGWFSSFTSWLSKVWTTRFRTPFVNAWNWVVGHVWNPVKSYFAHDIPAGFLTLTAWLAGTYHNLFISPFQRIWSWIQNGFWHPLKAFFTGNGPDTIQGAFTSAVNALGKIWNGLENVVRIPVEWVVDHVAQGVDFITDKLGMGKPMKGVETWKMATGGMVPGKGTGDIVPTMLTPGEYVLNKRAVQKLGLANVQMMNKESGPMSNKAVHRASGGIIPSPVSNFFGNAGRAIGSGIGKLGDLAKSGWGKAVDVGKITAALATGNTTALTNSLDDLTHGIPGAGTALTIGEGVGKKAVSSAVGWIKNLFTSSGMSSKGGIGFQPSAGVGQWSAMVLQALGMLHLPASLASRVLYQMQTESGGNPNAINNTDSNAAAGDPSRGLLQTIMSTFKAYHVAGTSNNIYDPLANIAAAINYAEHVYGPSLMRGGMGMGSGHGYANGGWINEPIKGVGQKTGKYYQFGEGGRREKVVPDSQANLPQGGGLSQDAIQIIAAIQNLTKVTNVRGQQQTAAFNGVGRGIIRH
jgi:SLT domain-containing protein/phage-related protein